MKKVMIVLAKFESIELSDPIPQEIAIDYSAWLMATAKCVENEVTDQEEANQILAQTQERMKRFAVSSQAISQRQLQILPQSMAKGIEELPDLPDILHNIFEDPAGETLDQRLILYNQVASDIFGLCYQDVTSPPDDLIHVSCSGYSSPSPTQVIAEQNNWFNTTVTHSYHMGCYGAFPAVRMATGFIAASIACLPKAKKRVDIVHTEFLSLHLNPLAQSASDIVQMSLFADGYIKYSAYSEQEFEHTSQRGLKILAIEEHLLPDSLAEMTWTLGPYQFDMFLSKYVPLHIRKSVRRFVTQLCEQINIDFEQEKERMAFAIHPGGPKILDYIREELGLEERQIEPSRRILYQHGNMSSATVPHIWAAIVDADDIPVGTKVLSMAFGPGLTACGILLEKV